MELSNYLVTSVNENLTDHFTLWEMFRSDVAARYGIDNRPPEEYVSKLRRICEKILEPARVHYGIPFRPNSGYRCEKLNKKVRGSKHSQHLVAEAVDFEIPSVSNYSLAVWLRQNLSHYDQIILECYTRGESNSGWVHVSLKMFNEQNRRQSLTYDGKKYVNGLLL